MDYGKELWYKRDKNDPFLPSVLCETIKTLDDNQEDVRSNNLRNLRLYSNRLYESLRADDPTMEKYTYASDRITCNVVRSIIDTAQALVATTPPRVMCLTSGGDYYQRQKAKNLTKFLDGMFSTLRAYPIGREVFKDAAIFGTGCLRVGHDEEQITLERLFPDEVVVDDVDARYGTPRNLYAYKEWDKSVLSALYPKAKEDIQHSTTFRTYRTFSRGVSDPVGVVECWHLPSSGKANDGRHIIAVEKGILVDEPWKRQAFPILFFRWDTNSIGFFGHGLSDILRPVQTEINYLLYKIQKIMNTSTMKIFIHGSTKVPEEQMNNQDAGFVRWNGSVKPEYVVMPTIGQEYFAQVETLIQRAYMESGISQMAAQSLKPAGIDSGKAMREFQNVQSQRFQVVGLTYNEFFVDLSRQLLYTAADLDEKLDGGYSVMAKGKGFLENIPWKEVALPEDDFIIEKYPTNLLSHTPAGRLQDVIELVGNFPQLQDYGLDLLDFPDIDSAKDIVCADKKIIEMTIGKILNKGTLLSPEPFMNLQWGLKYVNNAYQKAIVDEVPEDKLELFRAWIKQAMDLMKPPPQEVPEVPQGGIPPGAVPPAPAGMPPTPMPPEMMAQGGGMPPV